MKNQKERLSTQIIMKKIKKNNFIIIMMGFEKIFLSLNSINHVSQKEKYARINKKMSIIL